MDNDQRAFFELLRAGLWEKEVRLSPYKDIDFSAIMKLAEEQSVVGLVAAGLEHVAELIGPTVVLYHYFGLSHQNLHANILCLVLLFDESFDFRSELL